MTARLRACSLVAPAAAVALVLAGVGTAAAYFTSAGSGTATATVGTLKPPTAVTAELSGDDVAVSWSAPTDGVAATGYVVQRIATDGGGTEAACGTTPESPISATTCTDTAVAEGEYTYLVTALFNGSWTAVSDPSDALTVAAPAGRPTDVEEPTGPAAPTEPTEPAEPAEPTGPTGPTVPTDPTDPTDPTAPTEPTGPTGPTEPVESTEKAETPPAAARRAV